MQIQIDVSKVESFVRQHYTSLSFFTWYFIAYFVVRWYNTFNTKIEYDSYNKKFKQDGIFVDVEYIPIELKAFLCWVFSPVVFCLYLISKIVKIFGSGLYRIKKK